MAEEHIYSVWWITAELRKSILMKASDRMARAISRAATIPLLTVEKSRLHSSSPS